MVANNAHVAPYHNHILAALPIADIELLHPHLSRMTMVSGQVLHEENHPITDVFFIENGVISLTADTHDEGRVEVGLLRAKDLQVRQCSSTRTRRPFMSLLPGSG